MPTWNYKPPDLGSLPDKQKIEVLINAFYELNKRLSWITANLDSSNVKRLTMGETDITIGEDAINDTMIDWGSGANQVNLADVPVAANKDFSGYQILNIGKVGIGAASATELVSLGGNAARTIWMERHTTADTSGNDLTVQAGGATSGATDKNGGSLVIKPGTATGDGGSTVEVYRVKTNQGAGTTDRTPVKTVDIGDTSKFGIGSDYSEFEDTGTLRFNGNATAWKDENVAGVALGVGASPPDLIQINGGTIYTRAFDGGAITEQLFGGTELNHDYKEASDITFHIHWSPTTNNAGNVKWQFTYQWIEIDGSFAGAETTISVTQAAGGVAWSANKISFPAISGAGHEIASQLVFRLFRDPGDAADTYPDDAAITGTFGYHYELDTVGSRQITTK